MQVEKKELIKALEEVKPGLASKDIIAQSTSFIFQDGHITTFNDEIAISRPFDIDVTGAVRANELHSLLSKTKSDTIEFEATDNELRVIGKKSKAGIKLEPDVLLPANEIWDLEADYSDLPDTFLKAIRVASYCASSNMSRPHLTCVCIQGQYAVASDGFRIIRVDLGKRAKRIFKDQLLIPASAIKFLIKYPVIKFAKTSGWIHFITDTELTFSCRAYGAEFPDVDEYLNIEGEELQFPDSTLEILERTGIFTKENEEGIEFVKIIVENRKMVIRGEGNFGWVEETANCRYKGDRIEFMIDPIFLQDILKDLSKCIISDVALLFRGSNFEHVVCLVVD